ncbi:DUF1127 domain-containing protein [Roseovarius spongiae]|uniref:DUF1127 domain-containing protein n=2 Tax=Roseovarius spongiae TaxID=2320272 RepID=A0A3A8AXQ0_9RHOB|nr:DUF1127 domain-containing protein [Roseovarius spongiae]
MRMIHAALATIGHAMMRPGDARAEAARRQINHLQSLSDADLAARGIRREDIQMRVFSGHFYG